MRDFTSRLAIKNKCSFCTYWTGRSCMVTPSTYYCKAATDEYYQYLQNTKNNQTTQKSLRSWDKKK